MNPQHAAQLARGLAQLDLALDAPVQQQLLAFLDLLVKWNRAYNLTAVRDPAQMVSRHLLDSLAVAPWLNGEQILDVGSGAGLPGIPLALACPQRRFTLLDSNGKKTRFMTQAVLELGLKNVSVVHCRVEQFQSPRGFDTIIARAYATVGELLDQARHVCHPAGLFLIMKGVYPLAELEALPRGFRLEAAHALQVPQLEAERHLLIIRPEATATQAVETQRGI